MEFGSSHNFGAYYEWHGSTELRPGYPGYLQNPDSYNYYPYTPGAPSHKGDDYTGYPAGYDSTGYGTPIGWLGGSSSLYWMLDNPYMAGH